MKKYGKCICKGLSSDLLLDKSYEIIINENKNIFKCTINHIEHSLDLLTTYFKLFMTKEKLLELLKNNLSVTDEDIVEYTEDNKDMICIKYNNDFLYMYIERYGTTYDNAAYEFTLIVDIASDYLSHKKSFEIDLFEEDINKFCDLLKLMHK